MTSHKHKDPVEKVRELVTELVIELVKSVPEVDDALPYIIPCIMLRLGTMPVFDRNLHSRMPLGVLRLCSA
jgi:hypothetical protein